MLEFEGKVTLLRLTDIPQIYEGIIESHDGKYSVKMDVHEKIKIFDENDNVKVTIKKDLPEYEEGKDFCAWGIVYFIKEEESKVKVGISIGGLLFILTTSELRVRDMIKVGDKVYIHIKTLTAS